MLKTLAMAVVSFIFLACVPAQAQEISVVQYDGAAALSKKLNITTNELTESQCLTVPDGVTQKTFCNVTVSQLTRQEAKMFVTQLQAKVIGQEAESRALLVHAYKEAAQLSMSRSNAQSNYGGASLKRNQE